MGVLALTVVVSYDSIDLITAVILSIPSCVVNVTSV